MPGLAGCRCGLSMLSYKPFILCGNGAPMAARRILLGVTGGIAAYKSLDLIRLLKKNNNEVKTILTKSGKEYEELAVKIAEDKNFYKEIKDKLKKNIIDMPLFNSKLFTKKLETAYIEVYKNYNENIKPETIQIN